MENWEAEKEETCGFAKIQLLCRQEVGGCFRTEASLGDWRKVGASAVSKGKKLVIDKFFALGADNGNRTRLLSLGS